MRPLTAGSDVAAASEGLPSGATIARIGLAVSPDASWSFVPGAIVVIVALTVIYVRRWREVGASVARLVSFLAGMLLILVALVSPVDLLAPT